MAELFEGGGPLPLPEASYFRGVIDMVLEGVMDKDSAGARRRRTRR
jgi:hypothetical protein